MSEKSDWKSFLQTVEWEGGLISVALDHPSDGSFDIQLAAMLSKINSAYEECEKYIDMKCKELNIGEYGNYDEDVYEEEGEEDG